MEKHLFYYIRSIHNARFSENTNVQEAIANNQWRWPMEWNDQYPVLANLEVPQLVSEEDTTKWKKNDGNLL